MPIMGLTNTGRYKAMKDVYGAQHSIPLVRNQNGVVFEKRTVETELPVTFKTNGTSPDNYQLLGRCKVSGEKHIYLDEPLRGIEEYKDILDLSTGTVTRRIKKLVLTGEEIWGKDANRDGIDDYFYTDPISGLMRDSSAISSHFIFGRRDIVDSVWIGGSASSPRIVMEISKLYTGVISADDKAARISKFKSYLAAQYAAGTPVTVYYVLAEPTTEQVTVPSGLTGTIEGYCTQDGTPTPDSPIEIKSNGNELVNGKYSVTVKRSQNFPATIQMVGERTGNLVPPLSEWIDGYVISVNGDIHTPSDTMKEKTSPFIDINDIPRNHFFYMQHESGNFPNGGSGSVWTCIGYYDYKKAFISRPTLGGEDSVKRYTIPENAAYCRLSFRTYGETGNIMLNLGSTAIPYEPYGYKTTITQNGEEKTIYVGSEQLCDIPDTIGDYRDVLDYKSQTLTRWIKSMTLDGTEAFEKVGSGDTAYFRCEIGERGYARSLGVLCTHFKTAAVTSSTTDIAINVTNSSSTGKQYICIRPESADATTLADFLQFLSNQYSSGTPVKVWYALTEPETSSIDIPKLIEAPDFTPSVTDITTYNSTLSFKPTAKFTGQLRPAVFGFHVDPSITDPYNAVTYICDAEGLAPAKMGDTTFDYGSWKNAFFMPRPCMLNFDGTVAYYLDPDDYTKRDDGTASDIGDPTFNGSAMMEWPKIWWKFVATDTLGEGYFYVANEKLDDEFRCWSNIDANGEETDYFYTAIFNSTLHDGKFRSLSGYALTSANGSGGTTVDQEIAYCEANNSEGRHDWYTAVWSDRMLVNALLVLMGKSLDTQAVFGRGLDTGDQTAKEAYITGSLNQNGLFYGDTSAGSSAVKVFGMENWWGCCWSRTAGCVLSGGDFRVKPYYPYNTTGVGYYTLGTDPEANGIVTKMRYTPYGMKPAETTNDTTAAGYSDNYYKNASGDRYLGVGGRAGGGSACGAFSFALNFTAANASWYFSTTLSCKPESK